ncbi:nitroreductase family protein, partial [Pseudomonas sp. 71_D]|uniref:nitroreductase family protein n=1 Tax=Pseudomonas sp. 71_D TaxID=2813564 RepID=UPI001FAFEBCD
MTASYVHFYFPSNPVAVAALFAPGLETAIAERRDMRHFTGGSVEPQLLRRLLEAAHQAPSVGLMQPWRF